MTQGTLSDNGRESRIHQPVDRAAESRTLLEQARHNVVLLLADVSKPPRRLRVQVADIVVEVEWDSSGEPTTRPDVAAAPPEVEAGDYLTAPTVGVFYQSPEPGAAPFVVVGDIVRPGQQVGLVEVMKLMIPVEADRAGTVVKMLKGDGEPVEYGEPLVALAA